MASHDSAALSRGLMQLFSSLGGSVWVLSHMEFKSYVVEKILVHCIGRDQRGRREREEIRKGEEEERKEEGMQWEGRNEEVRGRIGGRGRGGRGWKAGG